MSIKLEGMNDLEQQKSTICCTYSVALRTSTAHISYAQGGIMLQQLWKKAKTSEVMPES